MMIKRRDVCLCGVLCLPLVLANCSTDVGHSARPLQAVCVDDDPNLSGTWVCPATLLVECDGGDGATSVDRIYVVPENASCEDLELFVEPGPFAPGTHEIVVVDQSDEFPVEICATTLTVVDTLPPEGEGNVIELWPSNHKMHEISADECVDIHDACDGDVDVTFTYVESDEPDDANGDGNTVGDIDVISSSRVALRAERMGGGNGRVYTLGWRAEDAAGNVAEGTCWVHVPHDQGGKPVVDDGPAMRVDVQ